jgi:ribonuclease G
MPDERRSAMTQHTPRHRPSPFASRIMSEEYLINFTPQETRVALLQQGVVQELHIERSASARHRRQHLSRRVVRVLPGMQSAFIDVGLERTAFLHVADIWEATARTARRRAPSSAC